MENGDGPKKQAILKDSNREDAESADQTFSVLMGDDDVDLRRAFIEASEYLMDEIDI